MSTTPPFSIPPAVLLWPIHVKGAIKRHNPLGDPKVQKYYHEALEDGRWLEKNIADANHWLLQRKEIIIQRIKNYLDLNRLAVDGELPDRPRAVKFIIDSLAFLQTVNEYMKDTLEVISAITQNIALLASMLQSLYAMINSILNALAVLLNNICNWGLPNLPSIPNLFSGTIWNWNGFNLNSFLPKIGFDLNFAFGQCQIHTPNTDIFRNYPSSLTTDSGLTYGTPLFVPPLGGIIPPMGYDISSAGFITNMQNNTDPVYGPTFNPNSSMLGSVPDPTTIISNYQMPPAIYHDNIVSIVPTLRSTTSLQRDLNHFINLDAVVSSNYDPYVTSAWLFYLDLARNGDLTHNGRSGIWLPQYEDAYATYIQPSVTNLANTPVPWNNVLSNTYITDFTQKHNIADYVSSTDTSIKKEIDGYYVTAHLDTTTWVVDSAATAAPVSIPLIDALTALPTDQLQLTLWKLSYIEASLLGYNRSKTWETYQNTNYLSGVTGSDLDYVPTVIDFTKTNSIVVGQGTATYPVTIVYPVAMALTLNTVIAQGILDIQRDTKYVSPRLGNRFVYDQFAQATQVDRFTQFWRDFNTNMTAFLSQDPYLIKFATTYFGTLNGALNPLGDQTAYTALKTDAASRSRSWTPGNPLLPVPQIPVVAYSNDSNAAVGENGWDSAGIQFDPATFLARPDIQALSIPVQIAMLRTNISYAGVKQYQQEAVSAIQSQIDNANALIQQTQSGFRVETTEANLTTVPAGSPGTPVAFDLLDFDVIKNVTTATTFTIHASGEYTIVGMLNWQGTDTGQVRTVTVLQNGEAIASQSTDPTYVAPLSLPFTAIGNFLEGDVVQVVASHDFSTPEIIGAGSYLSMIQMGAVATEMNIPSDATSSIMAFTTNVDVVPLTAVSVQSDGNLLPIDPVTVVTGAEGTIIYPNIDGIILGSASAGTQVIVGMTYGGVYQIQGITLTTGGLLYVGLGGILTQDYATLITQVKFIICVGRAIAPDTFIYEPHIPTRILDTM